MKGLKSIFKNINIKDFKKYLFISIVFIVVLILISSYQFIQARYESNVNAKLTPAIAFFIVDVGSETGQIELENIVPNEEPYVYMFTVSNYNDTKHADVDLRFNMEIITTTNLPLEYSIYSDDTLETELESLDTTFANADGVYFRHLAIDDTKSMPYSEDVTYEYYLVVDFPLEYKNNANEYPGMIELVDIKINAEQVVTS